MSQSRTSTILAVTGLFVALLLSVGLLLQSDYLSSVTGAGAGKRSNEKSTVSGRHGDLDDGDDEGDDGDSLIPTTGQSDGDGKEKGKGEKKKLSFKDQSYRRVLKACKKRIQLCEAKLSTSNDVYIGHIRRNAADEDPGIQGEVEQGKPLCLALADLVRQDDVQLVLELGTWNGGGSTLCMAEAMESLPGKLLFTLEFNEANWEVARLALKRYPVRCVLGATVAADDYLTPEQIPTSFKNEHYTNFYKAEVELAAYLEPMLKPMCESHSFDVVVHDGGEYTTEPEFEIISKICKPKYIVFRGRSNISQRSKILSEKLVDSCFKVVRNGQDPHLGDGGNIPWWIYKNEC